MGEVYLATDMTLVRQVALKLLPATLSRDSQARARLLSEARAASKLNHPNILTIYAEEEIEGQDFIVMEYVVGQTLKEVITSDRLDTNRVIEIALQVTEGLQAAHRADIVHRDIKPANIIIAPDGRAKIMDFGLATSRGGADAAQATTFTGTIAYASPEQIQGRDLDFRTDLWSLGAILYEMLAGRRPFYEEHGAATAYAIVHDMPAPLEEFRSDISVEMRRIVGKCLAKQLVERYQSATDLIADLKRAQKSLEYTTREGTGWLKEHRPSIAVLPFANLSADEEQEYFCDGMAEEIITALAQVRGLRVAARASAFAFKKRDEDAREIGRKLSVETLLEGSVRKSGRRLRIAAQLINVADGYHLWSERYDREMEDVFAIQDEIAKSIVRALRVILSEDEQRAIARVPTPHVEAYDYYLRGRQFLHQGRRKSFHFARQMFTRAIEIDSGYALAYAGIANCCSLLVHWYGDSADANVNQADRASQKALELAPGEAEVRAARGLALWLMKHNDEAQQEFETAIRLDPEHFEARYFYARACFQQGRFPEAVRLFEEACQVRENYEARFLAAQTYTALGRDADAQAAYQRAFQVVEKHIGLNPDDARAATMGAVSLCRLGEREKGLEWAARALAIDAEDAGVRYNVACLYALEGQTERAVACLEEAIKGGFANMEWLEKDPDLNSLRGDPRFQALLPKA
jgi:TolB-like protein/Flp pilus assembly protein TadD/predicted Ser/Thr protein kinase